MISIFVNSICAGMEDINNEFRCDHLYNQNTSYTITDYINENADRRSVLCSTCAKAELLRRLKKWANLDKAPYFYCGLLRPVDGVKIKYCENTPETIGHYMITSSNGEYLPNRGIVKKEVVPEGLEDSMADLFTIDLYNNNYNNEAKVYVCKHCFCDRFDDMIKIIRGATEIKNINYNSGQNYYEVKQCEKNKHLKLDYTVKLN